MLDFLGQSFGMLQRKWKTPKARRSGRNARQFCVQWNIFRENAGGSQRKEEMEILRTLGRRLGYLDREMQIKQIELLESGCGTDDKEDSSEKKCRSRRKSASP